MKQYQVKIGDGRTLTVEGPEDATDDELNAVVMEELGRRYPREQFQHVIDRGQPSAPPRRGEMTLADLVAGNEPQDDSALGGFLAGAIKPVDNLAEWLDATPVGAAVDDLGQVLGFPSVESAVAENEAWRANNTRTGFQLAGNIAGTLPLIRLPGGALAQGAAGGALLSDADSVGGVAADAAIGGIGGKVADTALRGAARLVAPQVSQGLRTLIDAGVRVTPGQVGRAMGGRLGRAIGRAEDRATSAPFLGDTVTEARNESLGDFARAAVNRALQPIGASLPADVPVGRQAVKWAGDKLNQGYKEIEGQIRVQGDEAFLDDLAEIQLAMPDMLPERASQFENILKGLGRFWEDGVTLSGKAYKDIETRLTTSINRYARSLDADQQQLGSMLESVRDALQDLAVRQNPAIGERLSQLNQGWKSLTQVERASGNSKAAISPSGYSQAVRQSSDTVRRRGYSRGEALNQDLSDAASDILPSEIADSGTAGRLNQQSLWATTLGAAQSPLYLGARRVAPLLTRDSFLSPEIAALLRQASPYAAVSAPTGVHALLPSQP